MTAPLLELKGVAKRFGGLRALSDVNMTVMPGEFVSVIGPNGAGKSTLFNVITGVLAPSEGSVFINGESVRKFRPDVISAKGFARTFQVVRAVGSLSIRENVILGAAGPRLRGLFSPFRSRSAEAALLNRVDELLEFTELSAIAGQMAREASPGHLRRMEIARALAGDPRMLLMDEPAAGIGADGLQSLKNLIGAIHKRGVSVLLVEHHLGLALSLCDRAIVLESGAVLAEGTPDRIRADRRVIDAYLGSQHADAATANGVQGAP
jgi:branched-chain amino acid transport system ATP-binding protein